MPDNLKTGISKACRYEPDINPTYHAMAAHYGTAVIPARVRTPKDKAKVEKGSSSWSAGSWRRSGTTRLPAGRTQWCDQGLLERLNTRPFQKLEGSRRSLFETLEKPALKPLPETPFVFAEWRHARVGIDYHIDVEGHYYSVPYALVKKKVEARYTAATVEILFKGNRVASHLRSYRKGKHTTTPEHMPSSHRR